jgi:DNA-binding SARP family transcriptional activator
MDIGILGPLEVRADDQVIDLGTPKARAVLAALVLRHGQVVSADHLIEAVWASDLPANPRAALQTNMARVRRALGTAGDGASRIETGPGATGCGSDPTSWTQSGSRR